MPLIRLLPQTKKDLVGQLIIHFANSSVTMQNTTLGFNNQDEISLLNPATESYKVAELGFANGTFLFSYLATFLSYITPHDLPVVYCVLELLRDTFRARVSLSDLIFEALKIESGFICLMSLFIVISVLPLGISIVWCCCAGGGFNGFGGNGGASFKRQRTREHQSSSISTTDTSSNYSSTGEIIPTTDESMNIQESLEERLNCQRRTLGFFLQTFLLFWAVGTIFMFITNEQIAMAIDKTPNVIRVSLKDAEFFVKDVYRHITSTLSSHTTALLDETTAEVNDIDKLLGEPIQLELAERTNLETIFENILNICSANIELVQRLGVIYKTVGMALQASGDAASRMEELQIQLSFIQRQCHNAADRPLCDTLRLKSFEEFGIMDCLLRLQKDKTLLRLYDLANVSHNNNFRDYELNEWRNLTVELEQAKAKFQKIPQLILEHSLDDRQIFLINLGRIQQITNEAVRDYGTVSRGIIDEIDRIWGQIIPYFEELNTVSSLIWTLGLSVALISLCTTMVFYGALSCGCWYSQHKAGITLIIGCVFLSIISISLAAFATFAMLLGGHGELFLCRPLYDEPNYFILRRLVDKPGLIYREESTNGLFHDLIMNTNSKWKHSNVTLNISLDQVITGCMNSESAYSVFHLEKLLGIHNLTNFESNFDLVELIQNIQAEPDELTNLTVPLQVLLEKIVIESSIDLTKYRLELGKQTPEREMATFSDQLQRVSVQIKDVATSSRMTTLGSRARRLQITVLHQLEQLKGELIYQITALDIQRKEWELTIQRSLNNLKFAQKFFKESAPEIFHAKSVTFQDGLIKKIKANVEMLNWSLNSPANGEGNCFPLYEIFDTNRLLFCKYLMDPINGLWFSTFCCILLFTIITPLSLSLAEIYDELRRTRKQLRHTNSHQYGAPSEALIIGEQSNWSSAAPRPSEVNIDRSNW